MENVKIFLTENYIWILVIILISIVTVIGFLADKKKNNKKELQAQGGQQPPVPAPMNMAPVQGVQPVAQQPQAPTMVQPTVNMAQTQVMQPVATPYGQVMMGQQQPQVIAQPMPTMPQQIVQETIPQPTEQISNTVVQEPMYQSLSEQKPVIQPIIAEPVAPVNETQPINMPIDINSQQPVMAKMTVPQMPMEQAQPMPVPINMNNAPVEPIVYEQQKTMPTVQMAPNMAQPTIAQQLPTAEPIQNNSYQNQANTLPQPVVAPLPVNFIYGPSQVNNQNQ